LANADAQSAYLRRHTVWPTSQAAHDIGHQLLALRPHCFIEAPSLNCQAGGLPRVRWPGAQAISVFAGQRVAERSNWTPQSICSESLALFWPYGSRVGRACAGVRRRGLAYRWTESDGNEFVLTRVWECAFSGKTNSCEVFYAVRPSPFLRPLPSPPCRCSPPGLVWQSP
jgi:hypothetical protein